MTSTSDRGVIERSEELRAITARWFDSISRLDADTAIARFSVMDGISAWGTDAGEYVDDPDQLLRYARLDLLERGHDAWQFGPMRIDAWVDGHVGWSLTHSTITLPIGPQEFRCTLIFHLEHDDWKIIHEHWSYAASAATHGGEVEHTLDLLLKAAGAERPDLTPWTSDEGTTTIVFTDIEGSTALNASFGDTAWMDVLRAHNGVVQDATTDHGGAVVKGQGDGFMLAFPSARRALTCALAIERGVASRFTDPGSPIRVRVGVHTGEAVSHSNDFFGHAVNVAARVAGSAQGGEILVSALVHELVDPTGTCTFGAPRAVELKGLAGPLSVYPLLGAD